MKFINLTGKKFGRLTVIKTVGKSKLGKYKWLCQCSCGNISKVAGSHLKNGHTKSCGCLLAETQKTISITHGMNQSIEYKTWTGMKRRCLNKNEKSYNHYGGRGIKVCKEWLNFENFYKDMGQKPEGLQIDRIDNSKGYYKENCRWVTSKQNNRNKRTNVMITYRGRTLCLSEWAEKLNINYEILRRRLRKGWSVNKVFNA